MRRAVAAIGVILLGLASIPRLRLELMPNVALPELRVSLWVAGSTADPEEVTSRWVVPIEAAIRSLGDVRGTRAEAGGDGASIAVRFARKTDVQVKAARLQSELAGLRATLPRNSTLSVWPAAARSDGWAALFALTDSRVDAARLAEELRAARGVRDVRMFGVPEREVEIAMTSDRVSPSEVMRALENLVPRPLGRTTAGNRKVTIVSSGAGVNVRDALLRSGTSLVPLSAVADIRSRTLEPEALARVNGNPAILLSVYRDPGVSLFAFHESLRDRLQDVSHEELSSDAAELRRMLGRMALSAVLASLVLALLGFFDGGPRGLTAGLYLPLAIAVTVNLFRFASMTIDVHTLVVSWIALAAFAPFALWRVVRSHRWPLVVAAVFAGLLPVAATYGSQALAPILSAPSKAFVLAACGGLLAALLAVPGPRPAARARTSFFARHHGHRAFLREAASVLLAGVTATCVLFTYFGDQLDPRAVGREESSTIGIDVSLPAGATLAQTTRFVDRIEKGLRQVEGIHRFTSLIEQGRADVTIDLNDSSRARRARWMLLINLHNHVPFVPGMITLDERTRGRSVSLADDFELQPYTDDEANTYRMLLKGTDAGALRRAVDLLEPRLARVNVPRSEIRSEWPVAASRVELVPRPGTSEGVVSNATERLEEQTVEPRSFRLTDGRIARVRSPAAPRSAEFVPQRVDVLARIPDLPALFDFRTVMIPGGLKRELGRFVLPVTINIPGSGDQEEHLRRRAELDRMIATTPLPAGVSIDRPSISEWSLSLRKLRLLALAAFLPSLLLATAAIVLSSLTRALFALGTGATGVAAAAFSMTLTSTNVDELTLVALGGSISATTAIAVVTMLRSGNDTAATYRAQRQFALPAIGAVAAVIVLLAIPASASNAATQGWRAPMLAGLAVLVVGIPAAVLLPPAVDVLRRDVRRRRSPAARAASRPAEWRDGGAISLSVCNVTKRYASGFLALHRVSFELTPGVIGLLGPNGAGKTTLLRIMTGLLTPTRGRVLYRGVAVGTSNLADYRRLIGFLPQEFNAYAGLTASDFLDFWALERGITGMRERHATVDRLLETVGLSQDATRRVRDFSGGMRQRIGIARALIGDPPLLIVDEPTTGLDLESRNRFRDLLGLLSTDRIVVLSTHIAGDVEATASRILLLVLGSLRFDGTAGALIERARGNVFEAVVGERDARALAARYRLTTRQRTAGGIRVRGVAPTATLLPGEAVEPTLEEAYLAAVGGERALNTSGFSFLFEKTSA